jgi:hypothetical protein
MIMVGVKESFLITVFIAKFMAQETETVLPIDIKIPWGKCSSPSVANFCLGMKGATTVLGSGDGCYFKSNCNAGVIGLRSYDRINYIMYTLVPPTYKETKTYFTMSRETIHFENPQKFLIDTSSGSRHSLNSKVYILGSVSTTGQCSTDISSNGKLSKSYEGLIARECSRIQDGNGQDYQVFSFSSTRKWPDEDEYEKELIISAEPTHVYLFDLILEGEQWNYRFLISLPSRALIFQKDGIRNGIESSDTVVPEVPKRSSLRGEDLKVMPRRDESEVVSPTEKTDSTVQRFQKSGKEMAPKDDGNESIAQVYPQRRIAEKESQSPTGKTMVLSFSLIFQILSFGLATYLAYRAYSMNKKIKNLIAFAYDRRKRDTKAVPPPFPPNLRSPETRSAPAIDPIPELSHSPRSRNRGVSIVTPSTETT